MYFWTGIEADGLQTVKIPFTAVTLASANSFADQIESLLDPVTELSTPGGTLPLDPPLLEPIFVNDSDPQNIRIFGGQRRGTGFTAVAQAIAFGRDLLLAQSAFEAARLVLDISGDGHENVDHNPAGCNNAVCNGRGFFFSQLDGALTDPDLFFAAVAAARAAALAAGVTTINALPIETDTPDLSEESTRPT